VTIVLVHFFSPGSLSFLDKIESLPGEFSFLTSAIFFPDIDHIVF